MKWESLQYVLEKICFSWRTKQCSILKRDEYILKFNNNSSWYNKAYLQNIQRFIHFTRIFKHCPSTRQTNIPNFWQIKVCCNISSYTHDSKAHGLSFNNVKTDFILRNHEAQNSSWPWKCEHPSLDAGGNPDKIRPTNIFYFPGKIASPHATVDARFATVF